MTPEEFQEALREKEAKDLRATRKFSENALVVWMDIAGHIDNQGEAVVVDLPALPAPEKQG